MWRERAEKRERESEYLESALARVFGDAKRMEAAEHQLSVAAAAEPLIAEAYATPQSLPHHAEGPFLDAHLRQILATLSAVGDGTLRLADIEELRRLKGYEGEIDELEETIRERQAFFEAFALCHDAAKFATTSCVGDSGTRGAELGFSLPPSAAWEDHGTAERSLLRRRYVELYRTFAGERRGMVPADIEASFFEAFGIRVHHLGHDRMIHAPVYRSLLSRVVLSHQLPASDAALLEDLIAHHLQPLTDFRATHPERIARYVAIAEARGYDADDFIDLLQGCVFLDIVAGSRRREGERSWSDIGILVHFLQSEHGYAPWKREEKEKARQEKQKRERNARFRVVGLDGVALMDLFGAEPGPKFGALLNALYLAIEGKGSLPNVSAAVLPELRKRIEKYYELTFPAGV